MKPLAQNTLIQNRYLIVHLIGKGGMGEVYLAVDQRLGSAVALKRTYFAGDEMLSTAFEREARILARMRHPVLPKVSDHFGEGEEQYLVMEHISGDDLAKRLEAAQKPFPLSWVMFWADQLLDALSYLHSHEPPIIHRDIKPQNLKLTDENHVILLDFGLSKNSTGQTQISDTGSSTGSVVGYTPHYAPMEQIRGIGTSPKSDLYSLSATLYQLLTNTVPPDALSRADSMLNGTPDPITPMSDLNAEVPRNVSDVILHGMEVSQDKRFGNAREMQKALRKSYAQMQDAMAAQTVAFSVEGNGAAESVPVSAPSLEKTELMDFAPAAPLVNAQTDVSSPQVVAEAQTNVAADQGAQAVDYDATLAFDPDVHPNAPVQSDVKTEVFLADGGNSLPVPEREVPVEQVLPANDDFGMTADYRADAGTTPSEPSVYSPDSTTPNIAFDDSQAGSGASDTAAPADFYTSPYIGQDQTAAGGHEYSQTEQNIPNDYAAASSEPSYSAVPPPHVQRKSSGKIFAILGGLFALFVLGAAALGGGWYYYTNYYSAVVEEPTPSPSIEITPSPEPSLETANSNVFEDSNSEVSNTNSNVTDDLTVWPTPTPGPASTPEQITTRPPDQTPPRNAQVKPRQSPPKPSPKPTSTRDRKIILQ